jgi:hypothetical protein
LLGNISVILYFRPLPMLDASWQHIIDELSDFQPEFFKFGIVTQVHKSPPCVRFSPHLKRSAP